MEQGEMHALGVVKWNVPLPDFVQQINRLIADAEAKDAVIPLPIRQATKAAYIEQMVLFNSRLNCEACHAKCCVNALSHPTVTLSAKEYELLCGLIGREKMNSFGIKKGEPVDVGPLHLESYDMPLPCPFLKAHRCSIYNHRPSICVIYPAGGRSFINGMPTMAVSSSCPEARRLVRSIYITAYHFSKAVLFKEALAALKGGEQWIR